MSDYEKQAQDFLESTGTELTVEYSHCGKYFPEDKQARADRQARPLCTLASGYSPAEYIPAEKVKREDMAIIKKARQ